ncbi:MAG: tyrosine-type recombinase/integrase [Hyphomicrobiaceae bacterium]
MEDGLRLQPHTRAWLEQSALEVHVSQYCAYLASRGYAPSTRRVYLGCVAHFARWMCREKLGLKRLDDDAMARYLIEHLPRCGCPEPARRIMHENRAALVHLLATLRASGAIAEPRKRHGRIEAELERFDQYMRQARGLADNTREQRVAIVRRLLSGAFGSRPVEPAQLGPAGVRRFIMDHTGKWSAGSMHVIAGTLRGYLRFRASQGDRVQALLAAIPRVAHWRLATLPEVPTEVEIERLLRSFDQPFPSSRRAYAMVRCLVDLGLRSSEVVGLSLDDIDWRGGTVRLAKPKSRRTDVLPLPRETGHAISSYLTSERPQTANRAVFVRHVAPFDEPIETGVVQRAVREAYRRCDLPYSRVHILRHSVASRLLSAGTPLKEIADVLRHRSLDTSAIYTKVDTVRLTAVAMPWPGSAAA